MIEMAVLLVIIGITVATVMPLVISGQKKNFLIEQKRAVRNARNEVLGYFKANDCTKLPNATEFAVLAHRADRMTAQLEYNYNDSASGAESIVLANGNTVNNVAFWVASLGQNRDPENVYTNTTIYLHDLYSDNFDDVVDYAVEVELASLCGGSPPPPGPLDPIDTSAYASNNLYEGNSGVIVQTVLRSTEKIKFNQTQSKARKDTKIRAISVAFENELHVDPDAHVLIEVSESVIFKSAITFQKNGQIQIRSFASYPIHVYMLPSVYSGLRISGNYSPSPPAQISSGGVTYVDIVLQSETLTIAP